MGYLQKRRRGGEGGGAAGDGGHLDFGQTSQRPARARGGEIPVFLVRRRVFGVTYKRSNIFFCDFLSCSFTPPYKIVHQVRSVADESALSVRMPGRTNLAFKKSLTGLDCFIEVARFYLNVSVRR